MSDDIKISVESVPSEISLDQKCWQCNGEGRTYDRREFCHMTCDLCNGIGYRLTDAGRAIFKLIERYGGKAK